SSLSGTTHGSAVRAALRQRIAENRDVHVPAQEKLSPAREGFKRAAPMSVCARVNAGRDGGNLPAECQSRSKARAAISRGGRNCGYRVVVALAPHRLLSPNSVGGGSARAVQSSAPRSRARNRLSVLPHIRGGLVECRFAANLYLHDLPLS